MSDRGRLVALVVGTACGPPPLPPDEGGIPLWFEVDLEGADDLDEPVGPVPRAEQRTTGDVSLVDVSDSVGLADLSAGGNTHGVGVAFVDVDGDDWADILVVSGRSNVTGDTYPSLHLRNRGDGTFENVSTISGFGPILDGIDGYSIAAGDLDADGDIDLYVGAQPRDILLANLGDGTFEDATAARGAGGPASDPSLVGDGKSKVVGIGDFDGDRHLDLVSASTTLPPPGAYLLRNRGDGTFEDVSESSGVHIGSTGNPCAVMWSDYDSDADVDLWIWNDRGNKVLLRNDGGGVLTDVTGAAGLDAVGITHPMGIDAADIDHDGDLDYYVSNIGNNPLLRNNGNGSFVDITRHAGTGGRYGWGLGFEDFDGDTWPDIFVAQEDDNPNLVFTHRGVLPPTYASMEVPHPGVVNSAAAHNVAVAFADYDHDGRVDVVTARTDGSRPTLYRNETDLGTHGMLDVVVAPDPAVDPGGGIGVRVAVSVGGQVQFLDIDGGSSRASQTEHTARFGLGQALGADWVAALCPDGRQAVVRNVGAGQRLVLQ